MSLVVEEVLWEKSPSGQIQGKPALVHVSPSESKVIGPLK